MLLQTGLSLLELGFRGRLAYRAALKTGLLRRCQTAHIAGRERTLPPEPCLHNVVLDEGEVSWVPAPDSPEEVLLNARELVSWKWGLRRKFLKKNAGEISYWAALARPPVEISDICSWHECPVREMSSRTFGCRLTVGDPVREVKKLFHSVVAPRRGGLIAWFPAIDYLPNYAELPSGDIEVLEAGPVKGLPPKV